MNFNYLLAEDSRYQYYILQYLELNKSAYVSVELVCEFSGLSKFKVKKYLGELNHDLMAFGLTDAITILANNEITTQRLDTMIVKKVRLAYLKKSGIYLLLQNAITKSLGIEVFAQQHFFSKSYAYSLKKQLTKILKAYQIEYRNNELHGEEIIVRNFLYTVYYDFYNGLEQPFSLELRQKTTQVVKQLTQHYLLDLTLVKNVKLALFLGVTIQRIQRHRVIEANQFSSMSVEIGDDKFSISRILNLQLEPEIDHGERDYVLTFLFAENMTKAYLGQNKLRRFEMIATGTNHISKTIMQTLALPLAIEQILYQQLLSVNLRLALFYAEISTFTSERQITFFQESYPTSSAVVLENLPTFMKQATVAPRLQLTMFYHYLFAIVESVPYQMLNPAIYVCVDFSSGSAYTHYIENQIMGFKNLNIIFEKNMTQKTQLFVSDFAQESLKIDQIIWKNPPSTDDWGDFGDIMIKIKKGLVLDEKVNG